MTIKLNHTIVHSVDPRASAEFLTSLFGLPPATREDRDAVTARDGVPHEVRSDEPRPAEDEHVEWRGGPAHVPGEPGSGPFEPARAGEHGAGRQGIAKEGASGLHGRRETRRRDGAHPARRLGGLALTSWADRGTRTAAPGYTRAARPPTAT